MQLKITSLQTKSCTLDLDVLIAQINATLMLLADNQIDWDIQNSIFRVEQGTAAVNLSLSWTFWDSWQLWYNSHVKLHGQHFNIVIRLQL